jgi:DNA-directed RNA polymerase specialized sigma subunit
MERLCIHPKEISWLTGRSERYGRHVQKKVREANNKLPHQLVTVEEVSAYLGLQKEEVLKQLSRHMV